MCESPNERLKGNEKYEFPGQFLARQKEMIFSEANKSPDVKAIFTASVSK